MTSSTDAKDIIDKASTVLSDAGATRWPVSELLGWLNAGQLEIVTLVPNANSDTATIQLTTGPKQQAPSDVVRIIEFVRNRGVSGTVNGSAIRQIERKHMDAYAPDWGRSTPNVNVIHAMYNAEYDNDTFYVWPPQPATPGYIEIIYSRRPSTIPDSNPGTKITVWDYYQNALLDYVLYRSFAKDSEYANQAQRSENHYKMFAQAIGAKFGADNNANNTKPQK